MNHNDLKEKWAGYSCMLNGVPAKVAGRLEKFASIMSDAGVEAEYSWEAVDHVMSSDRKFVTEAEDADETRKDKKIAELERLIGEKTERITTLEQAIKWVINDEHYKAPEQIARPVTDRWIEALKNAVKE